MPPKKRTAPTASKSQPKAKAPRTTKTKSVPKSSSKSTSKLKPHSKATPTKQSQTPQIRAAFDSYATDSRISTDDISRALRALGYPLPPSDFFGAEQEEEGLYFEEFNELAETLASTMADSDADDDAFNEDDGGALENSDGEQDGEEDDNDTTEIAEAFTLFTQFQPQYANLKAGDRRITVQDLARIAKELKEDVDEGTLKLMIEEANGEGGNGNGGQAWKKGVNLGDFGNVLRRAGAVG